MVGGSYRKTPVGAHYGLRDWLAQRITAVFMIVYTLVMGASIVFSGAKGYAAWKALFANNFTRVATLLFALALLYHAWVGMRDLWMDYITATGTRLLLQVCTVLLLLGYGVWAAAILWG